MLDMPAVEQKEVEAFGGVMCESSCLKMMKKPRHLMMFHALLDVFLVVFLKI